MPRFAPSEACVPTHARGTLTTADSTVGAFNGRNARPGDRGGARATPPLLTRVRCGPHCLLPSCAADALGAAAGGAGDALVSVVGPSSTGDGRLKLLLPLTS